MNQTCSGSFHGYGSFRPYLQSPAYTRYNMSFRTNKKEESVIEFGSQRISNRQEQISFVKSLSCDSGNQGIHTLTNNSFFPANCSRRDIGSKGSFEKHIRNLPKWIGIKEIDHSPVNRSTSNRNAFPQRKTKGSDQLIINMLMKYEKHYGRTKEDSNLTSIEVDKCTKKYKTKLKYFKVKDKDKTIK